MRTQTCTAALLLLNALSCKPSRSEVAPLVDARLAELGLLPSTTEDAGIMTEPPSSTALRATEDQAALSLLFLARLDDLMTDYTPPLPSIDDNADLLRCITSDALATDPALARSASALERKRQDSVRRRRKAVEDALRTTVSLQYRIDYDWKERGAKAAPVHSCLLTTYGPAGGTPRTEWLSHLSTKADCEGAGDSYRREWKLKTPEGPFKFTYSGTSAPPEEPPELMKRMTGAQLVAPERFACRVADVFASGKYRFVVWNGLRVAWRTSSRPESTASSSAPPRCESLRCFAFRGRLPLSTPAMS